MFSFDSNIGVPFIFVGASAIAMQCNALSASQNMEFCENSGLLEILCPFSCFCMTSKFLTTFQTMYNFFQMLNRKADSHFYAIFVFSKVG